MDRCLIKILTAILVLSTQGVFASQPHPALQTLIRDTLSTHPLLAAQRAATVASGFEADTARRQFLPTPSISVEQTVYENDLPGNNPDALSAVVRFDWLVYTGGRLTAQLDKAKSRESLAEAEWSQSRLELSTRVVEAWSGWVGSQLKVQAHVDSVQQHQRLLAMVQRRSEQGYSAVADVDFARLRLQSVESDLQTANAQLRINVAQMKIVSGKSQLDELSLPYELNMIGDSLDWAKRNDEHLLDKAISKSPSIVRSNALLRGSQAEVSIAKSKDWPVLTLSAEKRFGGVEIVDRLRDDRSRAFLGISTQFGAGFSHHTEQKQLIAQVESNKQLGLAEKQSISEQVAVDREGLLGAWQKIESLSVALASSERVLASWERQFLEGRKQWQDLMNAAREKLQLQTQLADAQAAVQLTGWRLYLNCEGVDALLAFAEVRPDE